MSYLKAAELLDLAMEVAGQRHGLPYSRIDARSSAPSHVGKRRNTQRLVKALEQVFGDRVSTGIGETGEKIVQLKGDRLQQILDLTPEEMTALDHAIVALSAANASSNAESLRQLRTKIRLLAPSKSLTRIDVDYDALLSGSHLVVRPGPSPKVNAAVMRPITEAILSLKQVAFDYESNGKVRRRAVDPYGVIFGHRIYLVARYSGSSPDPSSWRLDRMSRLEVLEAPSMRPDDFDIRAYAKRSFGAFHSPEQFDDVEWRFNAKVADSVRGFRFHPDQQLVEGADGSVTVRFRASGHLEMVWALYPWGDNVEVIKPEPVRRMVSGHQRSDFPAVP